METVSVGPGVSFEVMQGQKNGIPQEVLQTIHPVVAGSAIHQDEGVAKTPHQDKVAKGNVHMDDIQEAGVGAINCAPFV